MSEVGNELRLVFMYGGQGRSARRSWRAAARHWTLTPCAALADAAAADFVGDGVEARAPLRRMRVGVGDLASLLEVDGIGRVGDGGMALMLKTDSSGAVAARGTLRSAPN